MIKGQLESPGVAWSRLEQADVTRCASAGALGQPGRGVGSGFLPLGGISTLLEQSSPVSAIGSGEAGENEPLIRP